MSTSIDEDFVPEEPEGIPTGLSGAEKFAAICLRNKTKNDIVYADLLAKQIAFDQKMRDKIARAEAVTQHNAEITPSVTSQVVLSESCVF